MRTVFSQDEDTLNINGTTMINFTKWTRFHECMRGVFKHKPPDVTTYRQKNAEALAYLNSQLRVISIGPKVDEALAQRSRYLLNKEEALRAAGFVELHGVGMAS